MSKLAEFKQRYKNEVLLTRGGSISPSLDELWNDVLINELGDDPEKMSNLLEELRAEVNGKPTELPINERLDLIEQAVLELAIKDLGGLD